MVTHHTRLPYPHHTSWRKIAKHTEIMHMRHTIQNLMYWDDSWYHDNTIQVKKKYYFRFISGVRMVTVKSLKSALVKFDECCRWRESTILIQHWNPAGLLGQVVQNCSRLKFNLYYNFKKPAFQDLGMTNRDRHHWCHISLEAGARSPHFCIRCSFHHCTVDVTISGRGRRSDEFYWPEGHWNLLTCRCHAHAWCFMTKYHSILPFWV